MGTLTINNTYCGPITYTEYGLLYNWYATQGTGNASITSSDDWIVPNYTDFTALESYLTSQGYSGLDAKVLKEIGDTYWYPIPLESTNQYGFNWRGAGLRLYDTGGFSFIGSNARLWSNYDYNATQSIVYQASRTSNNANNIAQEKKYGHGIRLLYVGTGTPSNYVGNDNKRYRIVQIGTQWWLADNLAETKFRNGDIIPYHGTDNGSNFTNAEWAALTTAGCCAYDNDVNNVAPGFTFPS